MSRQMMLLDIDSAISSQVSADGLLHSDLRDGATTGKSGPARAHANRSPVQAKKSEKPTSATFGPRCSGSFESNILTACLASKLKTQLMTVGSTLYAMTWKVQTTPAGRLFYQLAASAHRQSDRDVFGWQTPRARGDAGGGRWRKRQAKNLEDQARIFALDRGLTEEEVAQLSLSATFCRRLMGYPEEWDACTDMEMPSSQS